jgi:hypothetical protein
MAVRPPYQPFYCEENIWMLCQNPRLAGARGLVGIITGQNSPQRNSRCALFHQRLAEGPGEAVLWDFHVVLFVQEDAWQTWDLDSDLGAPVPADQYLQATFGDQAAVPAHVRPRVRLVEAGTYVTNLRSNRSHMRDRSGRYLQIPPGWPPPGGGIEHNLDRFLNPDEDFLGTVVDLAALRTRLGLTAST